MRSATVTARGLRLPVALGTLALVLIAAAVMVVGTTAVRSEGVAPTAPQETETEDVTTTEDNVADVIVDARVTTYEVFLARDPFFPVIPAPAPASGEVPPGTAPGEVPPPTAPVPGQEPDPSATPTPTPSPTGPSNSDDPDDCVANQAVTCDGMVVSVVDTFVDDDGNPRAVMRVDSRLFEVGVGDRFAEHFLMVAIDPPCVTWLYGDARHNQCEGEAILK